MCRCPWPSSASAWLVPFRGRLRGRRSKNELPDVEGSDLRDRLDIRRPSHATSGVVTHDRAWTPRQLHKDWSRWQRRVKEVRQEVVPEQFKSYDEEFARVASFEQQLQSLSHRGFLRPYKAYEPPQDLDQRCGRLTV